MSEPLSAAEREIWDEYTRQYKPKLGEPRWQDAIRRLLAERRDLAAKLATSERLLATECSLSMNTTNAMLKAERERNALAGENHALLEGIEELQEQNKALAAEVERLRTTPCSSCGHRIACPSCGFTTCLVKEPGHG